MRTPDRQNALFGTRDVPRAHSLDVNKLQNYVTRVIGARPPISVREFKGALSNPTYLITASDGRCVLRRKPSGPVPPGTHAIDREFTVTAALSQRQYPVPRPIIYCDDERVVGAPFYLCEYVEGRQWFDPLMPGATVAERKAVYDSMNIYLARLHTFEPAALQLGQFGQGARYLGRQVEYWTRYYVMHRLGEVPEMNRLIRWLPDHLPPERPPRLVHGDFRIENLIIHPTEPRVIAVIDWELSTLGDPIADLVYNLLAWIMPRSDSPLVAGSLVGYDLDSLGIPSIEQYAGMYAMRVGAATISNLEVYIAYNLFRIAAVLQGVAKRLSEDKGDGEQLQMLETQIRSLAALGWNFANRAI